MTERVIVVQLHLPPVMVNPSKASKRTLDVEILVTSWCPYCRALEKFLGNHRIPFTRYDIEHDSRGIELYQFLGGGGVPITRIDKRTIIRGFVEQELKEALGINSRESQVIIGTLNIEHASDFPKS